MFIYVNVNIICFAIFCLRFMQKSFIAIKLKKKKPKYIEKKIGGLYLD